MPFPHPTPQVEGPWDPRIPKWGKLDYCCTIKIILYKFEIIYLKTFFKFKKFLKIVKPTVKNICITKNSLIFPGSAIIKFQHTFHLFGRGWVVIFQENIYIYYNYIFVKIRQRRLEFNSKLRDTPTNVNLWIEFIDFQVMSCLFYSGTKGRNPPPS